MVINTVAAMVMAFAAVAVVAGLRIAPRLVVARNTILLAAFVAIAARGHPVARVVVGIVARLHMAIVIGVRIAVSVEVSAKARIAYVVRDDPLAIPAIVAVAEASGSRLRQRDNDSEKYRQRRKNVPDTHDFYSSQMLLEREHLSLMTEIG